MESLISEYKNKAYMKFIKYVNEETNNFVLSEQF